MKTILISFLILTAINFNNSYAQSPGSKNFGFGIILGDPTGVTLKFWTQRENALVFDIGSSYFGSPRLDIDYLWHFDAFRSNIAKLYAGFGGVLGIGEGKGFYYTEHHGFYFRSDNGDGLGVRGVFGVNVIPRNSPLEFFLEVGLLVGLTPDFGEAGDVGIGMRFYP
ncbi:MAG: hypothetical protein P4L35_07470 [Ignavibacteriaceae bacterium]|nr:hypothetical protein [Ignavibacteriaceae bacterium]